MSRFPWVWASFAGASLSASAACGPPARPLSSPPGPAPSASAAATTSAVATASPGGVGAYEVHEWGVVDVPVAGPFEIGAGPGAPSLETDTPRPVKKPVLYFHLDPGAAAIEVDVTARIPRGALLEAWPKGEESANGVRWPKVRVGTCPQPAESFAFPIAAVRGSGWPSRDGFNEVFDLPTYETPDSACLNSGESAARLLFYRGSLPGTRLPIEVGRDEEGRSVLRASVAGPGLVLRTFGGGRGVQMPWPAVGTVTPLPEGLGQTLDGAALAKQLEREIVARGLTAPEARAFMNAWTTSFFGQRTAARGGDRSSAASCAPRVEGPPPAILYLLPEASVASVAELSLRPAPRVSKRVMVVRIALPE